MTVAMGKHSEWRKLAKKLRRKKIRQSFAQKRDALLEKEQKEKESSAEYQIWLADKEKVEAFRRNEEIKLNKEEHERWLRRELLAQQQWIKLQEKIIKARLEKEEQDLRIKKEWEEEQRKIKEAEEKRKQLEEERLRMHQELMNRIEEFISGNGELPSELLSGRETNPDKEMCPFFSKTGACRFGNSCSRNHKFPGVSTVLLAGNFYTNFSLDHSRQNEHGDDITLESDDKETYLHFEEFFNDVLPEFNKVGKVIQFKVCCNYEKHLRGNTYVEYSSISEALNAYRTFHGRWYGGKQITLQFCEIPSWKRAICGMFADKKCPKGRSCNFLHVFRNPGNLFRDIEQRRSRNENTKHRTHRRRSREGSWRWSESPTRETSHEKHRSSYNSKEHRRSPRDRSNRRSSARSERSEISNDAYDKSVRKDGSSRRRRGRSKENRQSPKRERRKGSREERRSSDSRRDGKKSSDKSKDSSNKKHRSNNDTDNI